MLIIIFPIFLANSRVTCQYNTNNCNWQHLKTKDNFFSMQIYCYFYNKWNDETISPKLHYTSIFTCAAYLCNKTNVGYLHHFFGTLITWPGNRKPALFSFSLISIVFLITALILWSCHRCWLVAGSELWIGLGLAAFPLLKCPCSARSTILITFKWLLDFLYVVKMVTLHLEFLFMVGDKVTGTKWIRAGGEHHS